MSLYGFERVSNTCTNTDPRRRKRECFGRCRPAPTGGRCSANRLSAKARLPRGRRGPGADVFGGRASAPATRCSRRRKTPPGTWLARHPRLQPPGVPRVLRNTSRRDVPKQTGGNALPGQGPISSSFQRDYEQWPRGKRLAANKHARKGQSTLEPNLTRPVFRNAEC